MGRAAREGPHHRGIARGGAERAWLVAIPSRADAGVALPRRSHLATVGPHATAERARPKPRQEEEEEDDEWDCGPLLENLDRKHVACVASADRKWGECMGRVTGPGDIFWEVIFQTCNRQQDADLRKCDRDKERERALFPPSCGASDATKMILRHWPVHCSDFGGCDGCLDRFDARIGS